MSYKLTDVEMITGGGKYITKADVIEKYPYLLNPSKSAGLWSWGYNGDGVLGDNSLNVHRSSPVQTSSQGISWKQVSPGHTHVMAIKTDGSMWGWGENAYGPIGNDEGSGSSKWSPITIGGNDWKSVSAGYRFTVAIKDAGTLWSWGYNGEGQRGANQSYTINRSSPTQVGTLTTWRSVSCGYAHAAAIRTDDVLFCWGRNGDGQLGDTSVANRSSPTQVIGYGNWKQVSCGQSITAGIRTDGQLYCWGNNSNGKLGDNTIEYKSFPVQTVAGGTNWKQVIAGYQLVTAIKTDGTLWTWGDNYWGQLGTGNTTTRSSPVQVTGTTWKQVSCGSNHTAAIKTDGTLWTWGYYGNGKLGTNSNTTRSSPAQTITGGANWKSVACSQQSTFAIKDFAEDF